MTAMPSMGGVLLPGCLVVGTIALWATARLPEYLTALLFFAAAMVLHIAPSEVVFSGFLSSAFWLVLSGFVLGVPAHRLLATARRWRGPTHLCPRLRHAL
jgi:steroid 5-alpha reductase family enzyme